MLRNRGSGGLPSNSQDYYGGYAGNSGGSASASASTGANAGGGGYGYGSSGNGNNSGSGSGSGGYGGYSGGSGGGYSGGGGAGAGAGGMYGGIASSSATSDNDKYSKQKRFGGSGGTPAFAFAAIGVLGLWTVLVMGLWWRASSTYQGILQAFKVENSGEALSLIQGLKQDLQGVERKVESSKRDTQRKYASQLSQLERENRFLQKERDELRVKYQGPDKKEAEARLQLREQAFQEQVTLLQKSAKKESKRTVLERFGPEPHQVQMTMAMASGEIFDMIIQMAPLDAVPHAVHLFLEQIDHGLWNHTYFYLNGPHVIQAGPQLEEDEEYEEHDGHDEHDEHEEHDEHGQHLEEDGSSAAMKPFEQLGLDKLAFPDYSDSFPHKPWTLGFTGRPGGPDWYINKVDNTESHGPGGQSQHALEEQGDSCFAIVVQGQEDISTKLYQQAIYGDQSEWHFFLEEPVEIVGAVVLKPKPQDASQQQQQQQAAAGGGGGSSKGASKGANDASNNQEDDPIQKINEKLKRKPRRPKIDHAVDP